MAQRKNEGGQERSDEAETSLRDTLHDDSPPFDLHRTLPTGAAFKQTWKLPALRPSEHPPTQADASNVSGVRRMPETTPPSSELSRGQTLVSMVPGVMPSEPPAGHSADLKRTQRLEFGVSVRTEPPPRHSVFQQNEPRDTLEPEPPTQAQSATRKAAFTHGSDGVLAASTHRVGDSEPEAHDSTRPRSHRPTDPFGQPAQRPSDTTRAVALADTEPSVPAFSMKDAQAYAQAENAAKTASTPSTSTPASTQPRVDSQAPARARSVTPTLRPAPSRWLAASVSLAAFAAAVGFIFLTTDSNDEPIVGETAHVVTPAPAVPEGAPAANVTELSTDPPGAEIVLSGAVIANTPARLSRGSYEVDYLVRLPGHDAQLIRIGPKSPAQITVRLLPLEPERSK